MARGILDENDSLSTIKGSCKFQMGKYHAAFYFLVVRVIEQMKDDICDGTIMEIEIENGYTLDVTMSMDTCLMDKKFWINYGKK